ncbi:helicase C-terminal domain-containing protein [Streptosporangium sp. NBC_01755]|uniref:helicase C-terminal domain-containing protein n=1 Tax=unclassified Streptosporangium TaxID=2632669 RepID=UPI002DD93EA6|nr:MULTISPECIES: helicase C-terminal domain-containing protein [unclassified Streptosporangium]WSA25772.1 helicase C-terminal domain-containing protein [Streptosporangium sp. NBC_01810]WSD02838.1 helicase C-terminal domain-containing protein [Streptosporangium sp. NBC_01755]
MSTEFTEWLRSQSDDRLRALVSVRPELITPVPAHLEGLAGRAGSPSAVGRALDRLDRFTLAVMETLVVLPGPVPYRSLRTQMARALPGTAGQAFQSALKEAVERLRTMALVYGPDRALTPAPGVREVLDGPAGLGPPAEEAFRHHSAERLAELVQDAGGEDGDTREALAALLGDPEIVGRLVEEVSPQARSALNELAWGPASGRVPNARREVRAATAKSPIEQLLSRALLAATGEETVVLPREVALFLRDGRIHRDLSPLPPATGGTEPDQRLADRTAAGQAFTFTRTVEELCERWSIDPPGVLRSGGLAVRDLKRVATLLDQPEWVAGLIIEVCYAAGLVAASGAVDGEWMPTPGYDGWRVKATEDRWAVLATAWLTMDRVPGVIGERDERDRLLNALHPDLRRAAAAEVRATTLAMLASTPGVAPTLDAVRMRLAWEQPRRRGGQRDQLVEFTLREAEQIGVTGLGLLSGHGRALLPEALDGPDVSGDPGIPGGGRAASAARLLLPLLPEPLDHVLLQADLTAVAPGPLTGDLRRWLALAAEVESTGGATVYRFDERSIRRALDSGQGAEEMLAMLERHSTTPVPQPLSYLVTDVARRHGRMRVGTASAYVRCDDSSLLDEVMADRRAIPLRLRRLAPTVIASKSSRPTLVDSLRAMGYAPAAESLDGDVIITQLDVRRTESTLAVRAPVTFGGPEADMVAAAVRAVRAGDAAHQARRAPVAAPGGQVPRSPATSTIVALREAIRQGSQVWIGYLDSQGNATSRILEPARMEGGYLTAYDETRAAVHRFALHRITGIADIA